MLIRLSIQKILKTKQHVTIKKQYGLILNSPLNLDFIFVFNKEDCDNKYMITFQGRDLTKGCSWIYHSEKNRDNDYKKLIKNFTV